MRVLYRSPATRLPPEPEAALGSRSADLDTVLAESGVVSLHVPSTPAMRHPIGRGTVGRMRAGAFLVNTARGSVADEAALAEALHGGRLGGAGPDVFDPEPPGPANPLFGPPDVVLTPRVGGGPSDTPGLNVATVMANLGRFFAGGGAGRTRSPCRAFQGAGGAAQTTADCRPQRRGTRERT